MSALYKDYFGKYSVLAYGAVGDGSTDDTAAIQAAIDAAIADGGGKVVFPRVSGYYKTTSSLTFTGAGNIPVILEGEPDQLDIYGAQINGNFADYIIKQETNNVQVLRAIRHLGIVNSHSSGGGIKWDNAQTGVIEKCTINAYTFGIQSNNDAYCLEVRNCNVNGTGTVGVGIHLTQGAVSQCSVTGWDVGIRTRNAGFLASGNRIEVCNTGIQLGVNPDHTYDSISGFSILSNQTERCMVACEVINGQHGIIAGNTWTATVGPAKDISNMAWAGGTMTVTSATPLANWWTWDSSGLTWDYWNTNTETRSVKIEGSQSGFNTGSSFVTATRTGANTFTYAASDPGASWNSSSTTWSFKPQFGTRIRSGTGVLFGPNGHSFQNLEQVGFDIKHDNQGSCSNIVYSGVQAGSWLLPQDISKAAHNFFNCDNPTAAFTYACLPGESGVTVATPIEGMRFAITDGAKSGGGTAAPGDAVQGGGSQHIPVFRTNSAWIYA